MPIWVNPEHTVATARYVMAGHRVRAVGVLDGPTLVGTLAYENLAGQPDDARVADVMRAVEQTVDSSMPVRAIAQLLAQHDLDHVAAVEDGRFLGIVGATMLLREMSRTWDPLTGLSWSDQLRDWGMEQFQEGRDVTIIFVDLDEFGQYNKRYGHIVGDRVLQRVAKYLRDSISEDTDVLVRYGGDEFAIGTVRSRAEAEQLVQLIEHRIAGTFIGEAEQPVSISIGVFGGRRTQERENIHIAATLDSLINLASRECMAAKTRKKEPEPAVAAPAAPTPSERPAPAAPPRREGITVVEVYADERNDRGVTMVTLDRDGAIHRGVHARSVGSSTLESVVMATFNAIERMVPDLALRMTDVQVADHGTGVSAVDVRGWSVAHGKETPISASAQVKDDLFAAAAEAAIGAALAHR